MIKVFNTFLHGPNRPNCPKYLSAAGPYCHNEASISGVSLLISEETNVPPILMNNVTMKNYFSLLWKKNTKNFQDILQNRNDPDPNNSAIHRNCFLTSPNLQETWLDVKTCPVQMPNPSHSYPRRAEHTHSCWPFALNPWNS